MWDDAQTLRKLYRALFGISLALVLFGVLHYALHLPIFAPRAVYLESVPQHVPLDMIGEVVHRDMPGNFFTANLEVTRHAFEQLPWVRTASVRRTGMETSSSMCRVRYSRRRAGSRCPTFPGRTMRLPR
jgi:cell division protein FtsQ